jgi:hypothetical protein
VFLGEDPCRRLGVDGSDKLSGIFHGRIVRIDHGLEDEGDDGLAEPRVGKCLLYPVADETLRLGDEIAERIRPGEGVVLRTLGCEEVIGVLIVCIQFSAWTNATSMTCSC